MTTYFFDENLSHRLAEALRAFGEDVRHVRHELGRGTPDEHWIPELGKRRWVLVTGDRKIRKRAHERKALQEAKIVGFFVDMKAFNGLDSPLRQAAWLFERWDELAQAASGARLGDHFRVRSRGKPRVDPLPRL